MTTQTYCPEIKETLKGCGEYSEQLRKSEIEEAIKLLKEGLK